MKRYLKIVVIALCVLVSCLVLCSYASVWTLYTATVPFGGSPENITITPNGIAFITDIGHASTSINAAGILLWIVDTKTNKQLGLLRVPSAVAIHSTSKGLVYVLSCSAQIQVVDSKQPFSARSIHIPRKADCTGWNDSLEGFAELPNGNVLLASGDAMYLVDSKSQVQHVPSFNSVNNLSAIGSLLSVSPSEMYIAGAILTDTVNYKSKGLIWTLDSDTFEIKGEIKNLPDSGFAYLTLINPGLAVAAYSKGLVVIDLSSDSVLDTILLNGVENIAGIIKVSETKLYVLSGQYWEGYEYSFFVVDLAKRQVVKKIALPPEAHRGAPQNAFALAPNGNVYVVHGFFKSRYVPDYVSPSGIGLYVINSKTDEVVGDIPFVVPLTNRLFPF